MVKIPTRIDINPYIVHEIIRKYVSEGKKFGRYQFKSIDHFFLYLQYWYERKLKFWDSYTIQLRDKLTGDMFEFVPDYRYTEKYKNKMLYRFYDTLELKLYYWITLTTVAYKGDNWLDYVKKLKEDTKYMWKRFYDYQKKYDKNIKFIRCYELTKKNTLHVHIAIYSKLTDKILKQNIVLQNERFGFVKAYKYTDHKRIWWVSNDKKTVYRPWMSRTWESYYDQGKVTWKKGKKNKVSAKLINYLIKYMSKEASLLHRAIFTFFRIRSYSISKNMQLRKFTRTTSEEWEIMQKYVSASID